MTLPKSPSSATSTVDGNAATEQILYATPLHTLWLSHIYPSRHLYHFSSQSRSVYQDTLNLILKGQVFHGDDATFLLVCVSKPTKPVYPPATVSVHHAHPANDEPIRICILLLDRGECKPVTLTSLAISASPALSGCLYPFTGKYARKSAPSGGHAATLSARTRKTHRHTLNLLNSPGISISAEYFVHYRLQPEEVLHSPLYRSLYPPNRHVYRHLYRNCDRRDCQRFSKILHSLVVPSSLPSNR